MRPDMRLAQAAIVMGPRAAPNPTIASLAPYTLALLACAAVACGPPSSGGAPSASASAAPPQASSVPAIGSSDRGDEVRPNYPKSSEPPLPIAQRLCAALYVVPFERRAACCKAPAPPTFAGECSRVLSEALRSKAATLAEADVAACEAATEAAAKTCDSSGAFASRAPDACTDLLKGTLADKSTCRSNLECVDGLRCIGVGPTTLGVCGKAAEVGKGCGMSVDPLAAMTGQTRWEKRHASCDGVCYRGRCQAPKEVGAECRGPTECGEGHFCIDNKCSDAKLPAVGAACLGRLCADGAVCAGSKCVALHKLGEACQNNLECDSRRCGDGRSAGVCEIACVTSSMAASPPKNK
jgi:hypothetical protein